MATSGSNRLKAAEVAAALEAVVGLAEEEEEESVEDEGVDGVSTAAVVTFTFIPWEQCPNVPHTKYRVPGLSSLTTSFPVLREFNDVLMSQFLYALSPASSTTLCNPCEYLKTATVNQSFDAHELKSEDSSQPWLPPTECCAAEACFMMIATAIVKIMSDERVLRKKVIHRIHDDGVGAACAFPARRTRRLVP